MIDLLHFKDTYDELVADVAEDVPVAQSAEFLQSARAAAMVMVEK